MEFFETPTWDGDNGGEKLTEDLFRPLIVSSVKVHKKRKRNKYPRGSGSDERSRAVDHPKEGKMAKTGKNKSLDLGKINDHQDQSLVSKGKISQKVITHEEKGKVQPSDKNADNIRSSFKGGSINSVSLTNSTLNSPISSDSSAKRRKKMKKHRNPKLEGENMKGASDHNLKCLQDKLDLAVKVDRCDKEVNESTCSDANEQELVKNITKSKMLDDSSHAIKKFRKKALVNLNYASKKGSLPSDLKYEMVALKKKNLKINTKGSINTSRSVILKQRKHSSHVQNLDIHSSPSLSQEGILVSDKVKKSKKKRKKDTGDGGENDKLVTQGSTSQTLEISNATTCKKRKLADDSASKNNRSKKFEKVGVTDADRNWSNKLPLPDSEVGLEQDEELDHVDGVKNPGGLLKSAASASPKKKLTLRDKMMEKLRGSRFRFLNEQMYKSRSQETKNFFSMDQESFEAYHEGYKQQLSQWPVKPVDIIIKYLKKKPAHFQIADFGCGDAKIAQSIPNQVHSFDYVALNGHVTACDMAHTPLCNGSVDVAVFCLSLMGSNMSDYIYEANRVLRIGGILKIAEVESRFENVEKFIRIICKYGFLCIGRDLSRDVFYLFDFKKEKNIKDGKSLPPIELRACSYKKR